MDLTDVGDLRAAMALAGVKPKKGLGQHFLIDRAARDKIIAAADLKSTDTILEIGPGLGVMTMPLAEVARVVAVETDPELAHLLRRDAPANLEVKEADILTFDTSHLPNGYKVIANLPYYLTGKVLRNLFEAPNRPVLMVVLVQHEVAERLTAKPGSLSVLGVSAQYYGRPELVGDVPRHSFWPPPKVDSAIVKIDLYPDGAFAAEPAKLFRLVKAGFGERRKQLKNALAGGLNASLETIQDLLSEAKIPNQRRAQELSLEDWRRLYLAASQRELLT